MACAAAGNFIPHSQNATQSREGDHHSGVDNEVTVGGAEVPHGNMRPHILARVEDLFQIHGELINSGPEGIVEPRLQCSRSDRQRDEQ